MKKLLLLSVALLFVNFVFGQFSKKLEVNVGLSVFAPVTKNVNTDNRAFGQRVQLGYKQNEKATYTLTLGYQQTKGGSVQMPVLAGLNHQIYKGLRVGLAFGPTFFNGDKGRFTMSPSISYTQNRITIEQSLFRTTKLYDNIDGEHFNNIGFSILYRL